MDGLEELKLSLKCDDHGDQEQGGSKRNMKNYEKVSMKKRQSANNFFLKLFKLKSFLFRFLSFCL